MKWLLVLLVVLAGVWWLRQSGRKRSRPSGGATGDKTSTSRHSTMGTGPQVMTRCVHCGVHLPQADAVHGPQGDYCSLEHRQQHEAGSR